MWDTTVIHILYTPHNKHTLNTTTPTPHPHTYTYPHTLTPTHPPTHTQHNHTHPHPHTHIHPHTHTHPHPPTPTSTHTHTPSHPHTLTRIGNRELHTHCVVWVEYKLVEWGLLVGRCECAGGCGRRGRFHTLSPLEGLKLYHTYNKILAVAGMCGCVTGMCALWCVSASSHQNERGYEIVTWMPAWVQFLEQLWPSWVLSVQSVWPVAPTTCRGLWTGRHPGFHMCLLQLLVSILTGAQWVSEGACDLTCYDNYECTTWVSTPGSISMTFTCTTITLP